MSDLGDYVERQREEGTLDSSGRFSMRLEQMLDRLARYGTGSDLEAVLKLIRAAIGWKSREIWLQASPYRLMLWVATLEAPSLELAPLFEGLASGGDTPERDLALGLCHFLTRKPATLALAQWRDGSPVAWSEIHGQEPSRSLRAPFRERAGLSCEVVWRAQPPLDTPMGDLEAACFYAPANLRVNGILLSHAHASSFMWTNSWRRTMGTPTLEYHRLSEGAGHGKLASRMLGSADFHVSFFQRKASGLPGAHIRIVGHWGEKPPDALPRAGASAEEEIRLAQGGAYRALNHGVVYFSEHHRHPDAEMLIYPVKRGVLLAPFAVACETPAVTVVLPADDLATDISQASLLEHEQRVLVPRARELVAEALRVAREQFTHPPPLQALSSHEDLVTRLSVAGAVVAGTLASLGGVVIPLGLAYAIYAGWRRQPAHITERFRSRLAYLTTFGAE